MMGMTEGVTGTGMLGFIALGSHAAGAPDGGSEAASPVVSPPPVDGAAPAGESAGACESCPPPTAAEDPKGKL